MKKYITLFSLLTIHIASIFCQIDLRKNVSTILNTNKGLSSSEVTCFEQDNQGFIWIGTTNGLCRFDGYDIKTYKSNYLSIDFFTGNNITCLAKDNKDQLWIGTTSGLNILSLRTGLTSKYTLTDLGCTVINAIAIGKNDDVYIASNRGVLVFSQITHKATALIDSQGKSVDNKYVQSVFIDSKNVLWIGLWQTGFCAYDINKNKFLFFPEIGAKELSVMSFFEDRDGYVWVSTWNTDGLYRLKKTVNENSLQIKIYPVKPKNKTAKSQPSIYNVVQDDQTGRIWIATSEGLKRLNNIADAESIVSCEISVNENVSDEIYTVYKDRTGMIWVSMFGTGCYALNLNKKHFYEYSFPEIKGKNEMNVVSSIYEDDNELLWMGVKSKVLVLFDRKHNRAIPYSEHPVLKNINVRANTIVSVMPNKSKDRLWLATRYYGLYMVTMKNGNPLAVEHFDETKLKSPNVNVIMRGRNDRIWIGSIKGVNYISGNGSDATVSSDPLIDKFIGENNINTIWNNGENEIWIGTQDNGLFKATLAGDGSASAITHYTLQNKKINNNNIICIYRDHKNRFWIGTQGGGLSCYDVQKDKFEAISVMSQMPDDVIYSIQEDASNNLWLSTGKGLVRYNPDLSFDHRVRIFTTNDNLEINSFLRGASYRCKNGELIFGGNNGVVWFEPQTFKDNIFSPVPQITDILISNISIMDMSEENSKKITDVNPSYTKRIEISYKENSLRIEFASLSFENSNSCRYAYRLEGIDNNWVYTSAKNNFAVYNNLKKGTYKFYVKAYNEDGYSSNGAAMLEIERLPAPWETVWAYIVYACIVLGILYMTLRIIINRMNMKRKLEIEHMELIKSEEVHQAKLQFFTNISHELFTPVTVLSCSLEDLEEEYPKEASLIYTMKINLNRLMRLLQQIMEFRKAETGNLKLRVSNGNIYRFIKDICTISFYPMIKTKDILLEIHTETPDLYGYFDPDKLDKIMFNLLSNAFKYSKANGRIDVFLQEKQKDGKNCIEICVSDTGSGIDSEKLPYLFTRFYEGDYRRFKTTGTGIGLSLTKDLVSLHKGEITVDSEKGKGTRFTVTLPIDESVYTADQIDNLEETDQVIKPAMPVPPAQREATNKENTRLLLVEDNTDLLNVMYNMLSKSFDVLVAGNGQEALVVLEKEVVDIVVTDVIMPMMDGIELCKQMKSKVELSHIPIVILTAKQNQEDKVQGFDAGADAYITKPFEMGTLVANVKSLVRNRMQNSIKFQKEDKIQLSEYVYNDVDEEFLQKAIQVVEENLKMNDFSTADFYQIMNMSQPTLYRKLKSITNLSPNEFIRNIKFKMACKLLTERNLNVSETAYELGFVDPRYFSSVFKKEIGISPTDYVKMYEKNRDYPSDNKLK